MIRELLSISAGFAGLGIIGIGMAHIVGNDDLLPWSELATAAGCVGVIVCFCIDALVKAL